MHITQSPEDDATASTGRIFLFPSSLDDEIHASQAARYHIDSGNRSTQTSFRQLYDAPPFRNTHWIPQHLERFARKLPGSAVANVEALLRDNTLFPLFEVFGNATLALSGQTIPVEQQIRHMPKRIVGESGEISLCFDCLRNDRDEHGTPYIHRAHQTPGVDVCWKHGSRLLNRCPFCRCPFERTDAADFVLAPWRPCSCCGQYLPDASFWRAKTEDKEVALDFARFSHDLLSSPTRPLSGALLVRIYKHRLAEQGLTRKTQVDWKSTTAALEAHFGIDFLARIDIAYRNGLDVPWFRLVSECSVFDAPIGRHLLLAHFLFGRADHFWRAVETLPPETTMKARSLPTVSMATKGHSIDDVAMDSASPPNVRLSSGDASLAPEKRKIVKLLGSHPEWSVDDLWRHHSGPMRQLFRKNSDALTWLSEYFTNKASSSKPLPARHQATSAEDAMWAEKIHEAARTEFISTNLPTKATRNYLMRKAGWKSRSPPDHLKFPLARQTLEALAESQWHYYARRILWAKLSVGAAATAPSSVIIPSGLEHHRGKDLLTYFSGIPVLRPLEPGTVMAILNEHRISKDWAGLPPNPKYYTPGRNYVPQYCDQRPGSSPQEQPAQQKHDWSA